MNFKSYIDNNERLKDFSATAFCFIVVMLFTKIFDNITFASFMTSLLHSLVTSSFIVLLTFVIYLITSLISKKFANIIISLIFGILVVNGILFAKLCNLSANIVCLFFKFRCFHQKSP